MDRNQNQNRNQIPNQSTRGSVKNLSSVMGDAVAATVLLRDWEKYGLSDRVCYHFDLTETLDFLSSSTTSCSTSLLSSSSSSPSGVPHHVRGGIRKNAAREATENGGNTVAYKKPNSNDDVKNDKYQDKSSILLQNKIENNGCCGVLGLLECVPFAPWNRLTRFQKRALRNEIRNFNLNADNMHNNRNNKFLCHEPKSLPLRLNPASRLFFTYEVTRIAFCLDASPTLTSTFGINHTEDDDEISVCCPMDRVGKMARTFFKALVQPIAVASMPYKRGGTWHPQITVSVVAVYPRGAGSPQTSLLVRDYKLCTLGGAEVLATKIEQWALEEVETQIAYRLDRRNGRFTSNTNNNVFSRTSTLLCGYDAWTVSSYTSSLKDILDVGDATLSNLSSQARPFIVVATDCRSVSCDSVIDILADADRTDVPIVVLDLSSPLSHVPKPINNSSSNNNTNNSSIGAISNIAGIAANKNVSNNVNNKSNAVVVDRYTYGTKIDYDPCDPASFPLHLSDDSEALLNICKATRGCFFDTQLLNDAAHTIAGQVEQDSPFIADHYFTFRRRSLKPNGIQWYTLFSLSPLSPTLNSSWGKLVQPRYFRHRRIAATLVDAAAPPIMAPHASSATATMMNNRARSNSITNDNVSNNRPFDPLSEFRRHKDPITTAIASSQQQRKQLSRITFSTYFVNPIRVKGILLMRVKEGYRVKQYGQSTQDPDKVFIQFHLPLELGTIFHYELSYRALKNQSHKVGVAHVKIELSGEAGFIQSVKNDFLRPVDNNYGQHLHHGHHHRRRPVTMMQQISAKLCKVLRWIRKEDVLQSYLCPLKWSDQLSGGPETPFLKRICTLTPLQRRKHFRFDQFEVVCIGKMPYIHDEDFFLNEFICLDDGERELVDAIENWSTQVIKKGRQYLKKIDTESSKKSIKSNDTSLAAYCVVEISKSQMASRIFTVAIECFGVSGASDRLVVSSSLKRALSDLKDVVVLSKHLSRHLVIGGGGLHSSTIAVNNLGGAGRRSRDDVQKLLPTIQHDQMKVFLKQHLLENHYHHASWDLVKDPEVFPLLMKRRIEIGNFKLLESSDYHALFAKCVPGRGHTVLSNDSPGIFVQYQMTILDNSIVIDLYMESESNVFFPFYPIQDLSISSNQNDNNSSNYSYNHSCNDNKDNKNISKFHKLAKNLKKRDQECGRALQYRTTLLQVFEKKPSLASIECKNEPSIPTKIKVNKPTYPVQEESHLKCVKRLLPYSSSVSRKLRFFQDAGNANEILQTLTVDMLLSKSFAVQVARLPIDLNEEIGDVDKGVWFIIKFDRHTISMVHLSILDKKEAIPDADDKAINDANANDHDYTIIHNNFGDGDKDDIGIDGAQHKNGRSCNLDKSSFVFRELTFFTIGISDLYSARNDVDDVGDDDTTDEHISEYLCVSEFADLVDIAHKENYSAASYLALTSSQSQSQSNVADNFHSADFVEVLSVCDFVQVAKVQIPSTLNKQDRSQDRNQRISPLCSKEQPKLQKLIGSVLYPVEGHSHCLYYHGVDRETVECDHQLGGTENESLGVFEDLEEVSLDDVSEDEENRERFTTLSDTLVGTACQLSSPEQNIDDVQGALNNLIKNSSDDDRESFFGLSWPPESTFKTLIAPPLFVKFTLDGKVASIDDLSHISKSSVLAVHVSVFKRNAVMESDHLHRQLHRSHGNVALALSDLLNIYVAEHTLERLRYNCGESLTESNLRLVKTCLRRYARDVVTQQLEVYFYVPKTDSMVPASAPAGREAQIEEGFALLMKELKSNRSVLLKCFSHDTFVVVSTNNTATAIDEFKKNKNEVACMTNLPFWCLISIRKRRGIISVEVHHPLGSEEANIVMSKVLYDVIYRCYHRVNQFVLLRGLHGSKIASEFLIPRAAHFEINNSDESSTPPKLFKPGTFSCPIVFRTPFALSHRCAKNPSQIARKLEATVLHNFAVSNRRGIFVYKDETGAIFYMTLESVGGGVEPNGKIELLVHGVQEPATSVTEQLKQLLQKRLLRIAVDMLSSILTKNPQFHWKKGDLSFIRYFEKEWKSITSAQQTAIDKKERLYELPMRLNDAGICLFYFRQNLCGSTFFHRLHESMTEGDARGNSVPSFDDISLTSPSTEIDFNSHDFTFYYNNAPLKLNPNFQAVSTLTDKGVEYSRQTGSGIAILEISLINRIDGKPVKKLCFENPICKPGKYFPALSKQIHLRRYTKLHEANADRDLALIRVRITSTALNNDCLHEWIHLCLKQAFAGWSIERQIEMMQYKISSFDNAIVSKTNCYLEIEKMAIVNKLCPRLPALINMLKSIHSLIHPAVSKIESEGVIRASSVATVTLDLLEKIIMKSIHAESRQLVSVRDLFADLCVIRLSRSEQPRVVKLDWDANKREAIVSSYSKNEKTVAIIRDSPVDCPEYLCFYCCPQYCLKSHDIRKNLPMLFKEVMVGDGSTEKSSEMAFLEQWKQHHSSPFFRSFTFVFSVKRNRRLLYTYNWIPQLLKTVSARLLEKNRSFVSSAARSMDLLQSRALKFLAPPIIGSQPKVAVDLNASGGDSRERRSNLDTRKKQPENVNPSKSSESVSPRRQTANRPVFIRRPKLIGKSVDGAARQAVAASRARASANRFRTTAATNSNKPTRGQRDDAGKSGKVIDSGQILGTLTSQIANEPRDEALKRANFCFDSIIKCDSDLSWSINTLQRKAARIVTADWWPIQTQQKIPRSVGDFILSKSSFAWIDTCEPLPIPVRFAVSFPLSFARTITMWTRGLELVPIASTHSSIATKVDSVLLMGEIKNVRSCKCFAVVEISRTRVKINGDCKEMMKSKGWVLTLPRRLNNDHKSTHKMMNSSLSEKDAAGMDKLMTHLHAALVLESLQFDFAGSVIERVMKSVDKSLEYKEVMPLIQSMTKRYPLQRQRWLQRLNYRVSEATIVLTSYENKLIDLYDAHILFRWLNAHSDSRDLIRCDNNSICFKQEIIIRGTHSTCFLTCKEKESTKMELIILCRTQGRDLTEFMFRQGSNVAISIMDNIAVEAAGLAYQELQIASKCIRRNALWKKISVEEIPDSNSLHEEVDEFLNLVCTKPLLHQGLHDSDMEIIQQILDCCEAEWKTICDSMKKNACFLPSWMFVYSDSFLHLFSLKADNVFLLIRISKDGCKINLNLVKKDGDIIGKQKQNSILQKFMNYLLHYLWHSI